MGAAVKRVIYKVCTMCPNEYTQAEWQRLPCIGLLPTEAGDDPVKEPAYTLELRNCECGTTLAVELAQG